MTHRLLFFTLVIGIALAVPALAQGDCGSACGSTPVAEKKQGCGANCGDECGDSCEGACKPTPLSARVAALIQNSQNGCEKSGKKLAAFYESCGASCDQTIIAKLETIEASAAKGCKKSAFKLAVLDARLAGKPDPKAPLSLRVAFMTEYAGKGCEVSSATLKALEADFDEASRKDLVAAIETLETKAANGSEECVAKLVVLEAKMPAARTAGKSKGSCSGEGCGIDCEDCGPDGKDCESGCPSGAPAKPAKSDKPDKPESGCGGCPSEAPAKSAKPEGGCGGCPSEKKQNA